MGDKRYYVIYKDSDEKAQVVGPDIKATVKSIQESQERHLGVDGVPYEDVQQMLEVCNSNLQEPEYLPVYSENNTLLALVYQSSTDKYVSLIPVTNFNTYRLTPKHFAANFTLDAVEHCYRISYALYYRIYNSLIHACGKPFTSFHYIFVDFEGDLHMAVTPCDKHCDRRDNWYRSDEIKDFEDILAGKCQETESYKLCSVKRNPAIKRKVPYAEYIYLNEAQQLVNEYHGYHEGSLVFTPIFGSDYYPVGYLCQDASIFVEASNFKAYVLKNYCVREELSALAEKSILDTSTARYMLAIVKVGDTVGTET